jgi:MFS family permease
VTPQRSTASIGSLGLSVYVPTFLFAVGQGAVVPIVPLVARELGASVAFAGLVVAVRGIGILAFDMPAGWLVSRYGEGRAMVVGTAIVVAALIGAILAASPLSFAAWSFVMGCGWSVWLLARLSYVTDTMPAELRGRALSTLGGINRVGNFVGPFVGALAARAFGLEGSYYVHIAMSLAACALIVMLLRGEEHYGSGQDHAPVEFLRIFRDHAPVFLTGGVAVASISSLRAARMSVLPLWAESVGLDAEAVSLIFGISVGLEMLLFYPAGSAMDRLGRKWVALPCTAIMALGMFLVPLTHDFATLVAVGLLIGFGNGLGSGIVMTLGADFSPAQGRAQFLGAWRLFSDLGNAGGPLIVAAATAAISLAGASVLMGGIGVLGSALLALRLPETLRHPAPTARSEASPSDSRRDSTPDPAASASPASD